MNPTIYSLQKLGFSQYEAQAYVTLLQHSPLSGYELAKVSGIPRPNIYPVLQKLEERGAILRFDTPQGSRYAAVSAQELIQRLRLHYQDSLEDAQRSLSQVDLNSTPEYIWNTLGYAAVLEHACGLIATAEETLLSALWPDEAAILDQDFRRAAQRGVTITTLCLASCPSACDHCQGHVLRYPVAPLQRQRWLMLIPDQRQLLAAEFKSSGEALGIRTSQKMLVDLAIWYVCHSIALAAILKDAGGEIEHLLSAQTLALLETLGAGGFQGNWLEYMRQILTHS